MNGSKQIKSRPTSEKDPINSKNKLSGKPKAEQNGREGKEPRDGSENSEDGQSGSDITEGEPSAGTSENGHVEEKPSRAARAKTARPNGIRKPARPAENGGVGGQGQTESAKKQTMKPSGNKLEPLDQSTQQKSSAANTPRSRGSDDSDSERKVSFQETPQDQGQSNVAVTTTPPSAPSADNGAGTSPNRSRQNSLSKKRNGNGNGNANHGPDRVWPATARETVSNDLARESPRHEGAVTWRKVNSDTSLVPRMGRETRDPDIWSDNSFGYGRCDQAFELTGRKFTRKPAKGNLG